MAEVKGMPEHIDDKLYTVKYKPDEKSHLNPNQEVCKTCSEKFCTHVCPANVYDWDDEQEKLLVGFENCLECGACRITCPEIDWKYPTAGCGVSFKFG